MVGEIARSRHIEEGDTLRVETRLGKGTENRKYSAKNKIEIESYNF